MKAAFDRSSIERAVTVSVRGSATTVIRAGRTGIMIAFIIRRVAIIWREIVRRWIGGVLLGLIVAGSLIRAGA
ncbi:MAG: hypothetical protein AB7U18_05060, partial [Dehalococcoidia bacterium]